MPLGLSILTSWLSLILNIASGHVQPRSLHLSTLVKGLVLALKTGCKAVGGKPSVLSQRLRVISDASVVTFCFLVEVYATGLALRFFLPMSDVLELWLWYVEFVSRFDGRDDA